MENTNNYLHTWPKWISYQILPKPTKTAVKNIYTQLLHKIYRKTYAKYKMTSIIITAWWELCLKGSPYYNCI